MPGIVICGAGGHAKVIADLARAAGWTVQGFVDELHPERVGEAFCDARVLDKSALLGGSAVAVAIGDCPARLRRAKELLAEGRDLPALVHPRAVVAASVKLGPGSQVVAGAVINPGTTLGVAVIVNTGATVDHDCAIGDGVHLAPGVHLAGHVTVGEGTLVGIGAVATPGVRIGRECVIGAGSVVVRELPDRSVAYGVPARLRER